MPPKLSNKKKRQSLESIWYQCEDCQKHLLTKDRSNHQKHCSNKENSKMNALDYIEEGVFYASTYKKKEFELDAVAHMPERFLDSIIYMADGVFRLLNIRIGQHVIIQPLDSSEVLIRSVWPLTDKHQTTVYVTPNDFENHWSKFKGCPVKIERIADHVLMPAKTATFELLNSDDFDDLNNNQLCSMAKTLKTHTNGLVYTKGNQLNLSFFNKTLKLQARSFESHMEKPANANIEDMLKEAVKNLTLKHKIHCFLILKSTEVTIEKSKNNEDIQYDEEEDITDFEEAVRIRKVDVGGLDSQMEIVEESLLLATGLKTKPNSLKVNRGVLLYGPSGCGKSMICEAMSSTFKEKCESKLFNLISINTSDIYSRFMGESEKNLRSYFEKAYSSYPNPTFIIIDNIHNLCPKSETKDLQRRINASFFSLLDELNRKKEGERTFILATTNDIDNLNPGLRRSGRFDCEVIVSAPSPKGREEILKCLLRRIEHHLSEEEIHDLSLVTHGFVGSDLVNLICTSSLTSIRKTGCEKPLLSAETIQEGLKLVKPSAMREILIQTPSVRWTDIGGHEEIKMKLVQSIDWPIKHPEKFKKFGIKPRKGILLYGPPGCSKTMFAKALATESNFNFISIKGPEIFSMWVGESERAIREVFQKARQVSPSIVFFDEIDAIGSERSEGGDGSGSSVKERVLTQLLTELDGVQALENVLVFAATNRPDLIDKALLRPGRIDRMIYVSLPDDKCREEIFTIKLKGLPISSEIQVPKLVERTKGYTGAEIAAVCHEAAYKTLEENFSADVITWDKFEYALKTIKPRTSQELLDLYEKYNKNN